MQYRTDKAGIVLHHWSRIVPSRRFAENLQTLIGDLNKAKPAAWKGIYLKKISVSSTMGVGIRVDQGSVTAQQ